MKEVILKILNGFYYPETPKFLDYESQVKYNQKVSDAISENLEKIYDINKK